MRIRVLQLIQKKGEQKFNYFINSPKLMSDLNRFRKLIKSIFISDKQISKIILKKL